MVSVMRNHTKRDVEMKERKDKIEEAGRPTAQVDDRARGHY